MDLQPCTDTGWILICAIRETYSTEFVWAYTGSILCFQSCSQADFYWFLPILAWVIHSFGKASRQRAPITDVRVKAILTSLARRLANIRKEDAGFTISAKMSKHFFLKVPTLKFKFPASRIWILNWIFRSTTKSLQPSLATACTLLCWLFPLYFVDWFCLSL